MRPDLVLDEDDKRKRFKYFQNDSVELEGTTLHEAQIPLLSNGERKKTFAIFGGLYWLNT